MLIFSNVLTVWMVLNLIMGVVNHEKEKVQWWGKWANVVIWCCFIIWALSL